MSAAAARAASRAGARGRDRRVSDGWLAVVSAVVGVLIVLVAVSTETATNAPSRTGVLLSGVFILLGLLLARVIGGPIHALSSLAVVMYCQLLLFVARPMYQLLEADSLNAFTGSAYGDAFLTVSIICGLGFVSICVGYAIGKTGARSTMPLEGISPFDESTWPTVRRALIIVVFVGFLLYSVYILQNGVGSFLSGVNAGRSELSRRSVAAASGYLTSGLQFSTGALIMLILGYRLRGDNSAAWLCLGVLSLAMYPEIAGGNRSVFIPILVALILALYATNPRVLSPLRVAIGGPVLFFLGIVAPRLWRDQLAQGGSLESSLIAAFNPAVAIEGFVGGLDTAMVDSFEVQLAAQQSGALDMQYGMTYIGAAGAAIPRDLWPAKPESVDQVLNAALFPALDAQGIGFSFGFYSEPYFNFGTIGVLMVAGFFGFFLGAITKALWAHRSPVFAFIFVMVTAFIFPIMRGSLSFDIQRLLIAALPTMLVMFLALRAANRTRYSTGGARRFKTDVSYSRS